MIWECLAIFVLVIYILAIFLVAFIIAIPILAILDLVIYMLFILVSLFLPSLFLSSIPCLVSAMFAVFVFAIQIQAILIARMGMARGCKGMDKAIISCHRHCMLVDNPRGYGQNHPIALFFIVLLLLIGRYPTNSSCSGLPCSGRPIREQVQL